MKNFIKFIDLSLRPNIVTYKINKSIKKVMYHNKFIMGHEVFELENKLKLISKAKYVITCSSGTDALIISLMSLNIKKNSIVFVPSFTFTSTAESVVLIGAIPFFIDINKYTLNIDLDELRYSINIVKKKIGCIIAVDLFGRPCDFNELNKISEKYNIPLIIDSAQSFGASYIKKKVGSIAFIAIISFFPTKTLGSFGDGGAVFTNNKNIYELAKSIRNHGENKDKYDNIRIGINGRLDTIQAALLIEKLMVLNKEIEMRSNIAINYTNNFKKHVIVPVFSKNIKPSWSQYAIILKNEKIRDNLKIYLSKHLISTNIYYKIPLHMQKAYKKFPHFEKRLLVSKYISKRILNLPIYPYMNKSIKNKIIFYVLNYIRNL